MSRQDFNELVRHAMGNEALVGLQSVVEKELLHYEILNALDHEGLLRGLVFQGGSSLRLCWGAERFSEDLDFAGGRDFDAAGMARLKTCIEESVGQRYGLVVRVKEPKSKDMSAEQVPVSTWQVSVITSPGNRAMPQQRVKIEVAAVPAYTREVVPIRKHYDVLDGTGTLIVPVESRSEILADKTVAFPSSLFERDGQPVDLASRKIRHRDIWDIAWLLRNGAELDDMLVGSKVRDYAVADYDAKVVKAQQRVQEIVSGDAFSSQMSRFLDADTFRRTILREEFLSYLGQTVRELLERARQGKAPDT